MKDTENLQAKLQNLCDCYATSDPLKEMSVIESADSPTEDADETAVKWLALAALHGLNHDAEKITITQSSTGEVEVTAKYRPSHLPAPKGDVAAKVFEAMGRITHMEGDKVKLPLSLGVRGDSVPLEVKMKNKEGGKKLTIKFDEDA